MVGLVYASFSFPDLFNFFLEMLEKNFQYTYICELLIIN